ncbi:hypothetical protein [Amycolatopsis sp. WAC 01376]|uniref:hypothetical protein n=1 Tax=Amycolatopsis sp. WAC 01376 TaxID=2203195 RepID=UPI0013157D98|nr:hypothetical protein [Amycolatopsis sp. WAC 01376]
MEITPLPEYEPPTRERVSALELAALRAVRDGSVVRSAGTWSVAHEDMDGDRATAFTVLLGRGLISLQAKDFGHGNQADVTLRGLGVIGANDHRAAEI